MPAPYRDAALWIGPTGVGKPALSEERRRAKQREDAYRRIGERQAQLVPYKGRETAAPRPAFQSAEPTKPLTQMCIAGVLKVMTSPGVWKDAGGCARRDPGGWRAPGSSYKRAPAEMRDSERPERS
ncbi:MAG TPA: hypothetical protein VJX92_25440 [Methylomirabilota bacterium]|nr:hypothetical protein [Methylomirabilota bacterium]